MNSSNWQHTYIDSIYPLAEDIFMLDPWSLPASPFMLYVDDVQILVDFVALPDSDIRILRFTLDEDGMRSWLTEQDMIHERGRFAAETAINIYDGNYYEIGYQMPALNDFEKLVSEKYTQPITFRRQQPGYRPLSITRRHEFDQLGHYLQAVRQLAIKKQLPTQKMDKQTQTYHGYGLHLPAFQLTENGPIATEPFVWSYKDWLSPKGRVIDEFSNARVRFLPAQSDTYELFFFYLPVPGIHKSMLTMTFFLVNLETGMIEWTETLTPLAGWEETLLRHLWAYFDYQGQRPHTILSFHSTLCCYLLADMKDAGIKLEHIPHSFTADELLENYLQEHFDIDTTEYAPEEPY